MNQSRYRGVTELLFESERLLQLSSTLIDECDGACDYLQSASKRSAIVCVYAGRLLETIAPRSLFKQEHT